MAAEEGNESPGGASHSSTLEDASGTVLGANDEAETGLPKPVSQ